MAFTIFATPRSCTMTASTAASAQARIAASMRGSSSSNTSVFSVTYPLAPRSWCERIVSRSAPPSKFVARARAV